MGHVVKIVGLPPGSILSASADAKFVRLRTNTSDLYFDTTRPAATVGVPLAARPYGVRFVGSGVAPKPSDRLTLVRCHMRFGGSFNRKDARYLLEGATYATRVEWRPGEWLPCHMSGVQKMTQHGAVLLGIVVDKFEGQVDPDERVVAMFDILGFSAIVDTTPLDELEERITQQLGIALRLSGAMSAGAMVFEGTELSDRSEPLAGVGQSVMLDTILLYSHDMDPDPLQSVCVAAAILMDTFLRGGWLLRGAIDVGPFRAVPHHPVFIGPALTGAHRSEIQQNWSGCVLTANCARRCRREVRSMARRGLLVNYPVPLKEQAAGPRRWALNWSYYKWNEPDERIAKLDQLLDAAPPTAKGKLIATRTFCLEVMKRGLASRKDLTVQAIGLDLTKREKS